MQFGETITRITPGAIIDPYSLTEAADWTNPTSTLIEGCVVFPVGAVGHETSGVGRDQIARQQLTVLLPPGVQLDPTDRVMFRGEQFEVVGFTFGFQNPFTGWNPGGQSTIRRIEG